MLITCYECGGTGCHTCRDTGRIVTPDTHDVWEAYEGRNLDQLVKIYTTTLHCLTEIEQRYNRFILERLDFQSRTALDKQEKAILQQDALMSEFSDAISDLKAVLRACSFALDCLRLQIKKEVSA